MFTRAKLICNPYAKRVPVFRKTIEANPGDEGRITVSALGVFQVFVNGEKLGRDLLSPGWENYDKRVGAVSYVFRAKKKNVITVVVAPGWFSGKINLGNHPPVHPLAMIAEGEVSGKKFVSDKSWEVADSRIVSSDIYDGIVYDATAREVYSPASVYLGFDKSLFSPADGLPVVVSKVVFPSQKVIRTPKGETVLDFGENLVGYPTLSITAKRGERVKLSFAEVLDKDGNFYNDNYRDAKCVFEYVAKEGRQEFIPIGTFFGFRYLRIDEFPGEYSHGAITACVIHSDLSRTGNIKCGDPLVNRLFENIIRGQLGNYVDIPTDCPQRDERLGWTGDAEVFVKAAAYNFDVLTFFRKWLTDAVLSQTERGGLPDFLPTPRLRYPEHYDVNPRAAWTDFIAIIPYELYRVYGDKSILSLTYPAMLRYLRLIGEITMTKDLWTGGFQYGDWLGLDAKPDSYDGATNKYIAASAYYAHVADLVARVARILGEDPTEAEEIFRRVRAKYIETYEKDLSTQTECVLTLAFGLTDHEKEIGDRLVSRIEKAGGKLETGFMGTGLILHALTAIGRNDIAYDLLLEKDFPSWLYPVTKGATTIWEHWDGIRPDGTFWSRDMNSYNHYAYGAVADWLYAVAGGITCDEEDAGYVRARIAPIPDKRLGTLEVRFKVKAGEIVSSWYYEGDVPHYRIETPVPATIVVDGVKYDTAPGVYVF